MPVLRVENDEQHEEELADARDLVAAWDALAEAGAPVARMEREARARVRDLEDEERA